jgi:hypothetical protein
MKWGEKVDGNFFVASDAFRSKFLKNGCDANSLVGDPMFLDPSKGDYSVKQGSPALKIGFKNFPMDQFGVQKPELKGKAKTPELPDVKAGGISAPKSSVTVRTWMGLQIKDMEGEEFSAYGVAKDSGGVEIMGGFHPPLQPGDLIQSLNGYSVKNCADLEKVAITHPMTSGIIRNQQPAQMVLP